MCIMYKIFLSPRPTFIDPEMDEFKRVRDQGEISLRILKHRLAASNLRFCREARMIR